MKTSKEIEVKARVKNISSIRSAFERLGCVFGEILTQEDTVYLPNGVTFEHIEKGTNALRIRVENARTIFTLKQRQNVELSAIEAETQVQDKKELQRIIELLGYYEAIHITKRRQKAQFGDLEICLDEVDGLGAYVEVQKFSDLDGKRIQAELFSFLETCGIKRSDREKKGYDTLLYELKSHERKI